MRLSRAVTAFVLSGCTLPAAAQDPHGKAITAPGGFVPAQAIYCDDHTGHAAATSTVAAGTASTAAGPVQNADGSKLASDAQLVTAVTQLTVIVAKQAAILSALQGTLLVQQAPVAAAGTPALGTVTASGVTSTSGTGSFAGGTAIIPFAAQVNGGSIRVILRPTGAFTAYVGTSIDGCATINPLTVAGQPWASFTGPADEYVDTPVSTATAASIRHCLVVTPAAGTTVTYGIRQ